MKTRKEQNRKIAIVGGGASGVLTALHLVRQETLAEVILIDRKPDLGLGLAYSTPSLRHLLNVPAGKISALPDEPDHFLNWLRANYDPAATEKTFAPRAIFGRYIQSIFATVQGITKIVADVVNVSTEECGAVVTLEDGRVLRVDLVVLAMGNFDPAPLAGVSDEAIAKGRYHHNAWSEKTYKGIPTDAPVVIIGTGLTGVDVVLRLRELGHRGKIIAISRHGVFPNRHREYMPLQYSAIPVDTPATAVAYLKALHGVIRAGAEWRAAVDSLRSTTNELWLRLPLAEKKRFRCHLQRRWDVVRHRMAPPIADVIESEITSGMLEVREGHFKAVDAAADGVYVIVRGHHGDESFYVDRAINCTGPSMNYRRVASVLMQNLFAQGVVSAGPLGGGFHCAANGAVVDAQGQTSEILFNLGPGRLGDLLESIAVPEIRQQAVELAATLNERLTALDAVKVDRADKESEWVVA